MKIKDKFVSVEEKEYKEICAYLLNEGLIITFIPFNIDQLVYHLNICHTDLTYDKLKNTTIRTILINKFHDMTRWLFTTNNTDGLGYLTDRITFFRTPGYRRENLNENL